MKLELAINKLTRTKTVYFTSAVDLLDTAQRLSPESSDYLDPLALATLDRASSIQETLSTLTNT